MRNADADRCEVCGRPRADCQADYDTNQGTTVPSTPSTRTEPQPKTIWAAYAGTAVGDEISLHRTEREALEAIADTLWGDQPGEEDQRPLTDDELREAIEDHCTSRADDWCVQEVTLP